MLSINQPVPSFQAHAFHQGQFTQVTDASLRGRWSVVFFYPADFTFVCPTELEELADHYATFAQMGVEVFAVSTDTHFAHKAWHDHSPAIKKIQFPMVGDPAHYLSKGFGVLNDEGLAHRGTFVINPDGVIKSVEVSSDGVGRSAEELIRKIKALQYIAAHPNEVCPAKWKEGATTLTPSLDLVGKI